MPWFGWIGVGIALIGVEILVTTDFVLALAGVAALSVGAATAAGLPMAPSLQWAAFAVLSVGLCVFVRRALPRYAPGVSPDALPNGETAIAVDAIDSHESGAVELRGSPWKARNCGRSAIAKGEAAIVERIDGLVVVVRSQREARARRRNRRKEKQWNS